MLKTQWAQNGFRRKSPQIMGHFVQQTVYISSHRLPLLQTSGHGEARRPPSLLRLQTAFLFDPPSNPSSMSKSLASFPPLLIGAFPDQHEPASRRRRPPQRRQVHPLQRRRMSPFLVILLPVLVHVLASHHSFLLLLRLHTYVRTYVFGVPFHWKEKNKRLDI